MTRTITNLRLRIRSTDGFSVVEVVVAALLVALSALGVMGLVDTASRNNFRAEQSQVVSDRLQQEMEAIKRLPYTQVALTALPQEAASAADPDSRVRGAEFNVNRSGASAYWNLVYNGGHSNETGRTVSGGTIQPASTFEVGNVRGTVYRYVVWKPNVECSNCAHQPDSDSYDGRQVAWFKHVVVAVLLDPTASGGTREYQEVGSDIGNPDTSQGTGPGGGPSNNDETPWTFWLTDTPCDEDARQPIVEDPAGSGGHPTHNTLGTCAAGLKTGPPTATGENAGAPDLMMTKPAPCSSDECAAETLYDYSNDLVINPGLDKGVQKTVPNGTVGDGECLTDITSTSSLLALGPNPQWYVHKWVSLPIPSGWNDVVLSGSGAMYLWTQTISDASYAGRICVWLFRRSQGAAGVAVDAMPLNTKTSDACDSSRSIGANRPYHQCSRAPWPSSEWTEVTVSLAFSQLTLSPGDRLGVAIGVERQGTQGAGLQFIYDAPTYDARVELNTKSSLPF